MPKLMFGKKRVLVVGKSKQERDRLFKLAKKQYHSAYKIKLHGVYLLAL